MVDILDVQPFEICSIRPPTENYSLTFRLARNCYWNRCAFCPVYKFGAKFSKRSLKEIKQDIQNAKNLDDYLFENGVGFPVYSSADYGKALSLVERIQREQWEAGIVPQYEDSLPRELPEDLDERLVWFLSWIKDRPTLRDSVEHLVTWRMGGSRTCFLGDADSLIHKPAFMQEVMDYIRIHFPSLERFTIYGRTRTASRNRSLKELKGFAKAGINRVHFGLESGSDRVLEMVNKGETAGDHVKGGIKTREAGLSCSVYVMPGLGGVKYSGEHARETALVISEIQPDFVRLRTLEVFPGTPIDEARRRREFTECPEEMVVEELRIMIEEMDVDTEIMSDSATNLLHVAGRLPRDRQHMLEVIDGYLALPEREKREFSLKARLQSFMGQYGEVTDDIMEKIEPYLDGSSLRMEDISDVQLEEITRLIRGKLMP